MAYNNIFPTTYQPIGYSAPQYQIPQAQPVQQVQNPTQQNNPMIWVQGETGAKSYLLAPNTTLPLWDSENQVIYLKSADASGMPSMKILDYKIRDAVQPQQQVITDPNSSNDYVTHKELNDLEKKITYKLEELSKEDLGA